MAESTTVPAPAPISSPTLHPVIADQVAADQVRLLRVVQIPAEFPKCWQTQVVNFSGMPGNEDPLHSMKHWVLPTYYLSEFQIQLKQLQHFIS